ncbi:hypothetical protein Nepgr_023523 [Nepenthes gracilis]|uniref:Uncharacterized protein n=1 Tax=Nepenthes gracilis TaxID=150966 RepID=A0AAD3T4F3_NEPGR|nr:hypothetical protein Nepgr_023523 [Nepenthes gracilis]
MAPNAVRHGRPSITLYTESMSTTRKLVVNATVRNQYGYNKGIRMGKIICAKSLSLKLITLSAVCCFFLPVCCSLSSTGFLADRVVIMLTTPIATRFYIGEGSGPSPRSARALTRALNESSEMALLISSSISRWRVLSHLWSVREIDKNRNTLSDFLPPPS